MEHKHSVHDSDTRFSINPITRQMKNESGKKNTLIQNDHNSEIFTFECPRTIEGHDMSLCNEVQVHFLNIGKDGQEKTGLYTAQDFHDEDDKVIFSWPIDHNATGLVGSLNFLALFKCLEDGVITYAWHTGIYQGITIAEGINADESFEFDYADVIERWKDSVMAHFTAELAAWMNKTALEVREEVNERIDLLSNYVTPQMFGAKGDGVTDDTEAFQMAVNQLGATVSSMVVPYGVYHLTDSIVMTNKSNIQIVGVGRPVIKFASQNETKSGFHFTNYKDIEVSGFSFVSTRDKIEYPPTGHGTVGYASSNILAVYIANGENATFKDNHFSGMTADYWFVGGEGTVNKNILVDGWHSENASMPTFCKYLDNAEFRNAKLYPATNIGAGNHLFYFGTLCKGVRIINCDGEALDNTLSCLISFYNATKEDDQTVQPVDLLVRNFNGKGCRLFVGNKWAKIRFENVYFEQIYDTYLTDNTAASGAVYADVETANGYYGEIEFVGCDIITHNADLISDNAHSTKVLIESSNIDLGTGGLILHNSNTIIKNNDIICGTLVYSRPAGENLSVYIANNRINTNSFIISRRNGYNGVFDVANNIITGNKSRCLYSSGSSDGSGIRLLNNYMFNMNATYPIGEAIDMANLTSLGNYANGVPI